MVRILIVDDEPDIIGVAKNMLGKASYETDEAGNGEACLEKLKKKKFDLILLDVMLPDDNGWEVCRKIKADEKTKDIPVLMFTVRTDADDRKIGREVGAIAQIDKPFGREELIGTIERVLNDS